MQHPGRGVRKRAQPPSPAPVIIRSALLSVVLALSACDTSQNENLFDGLELTQDPAALVGAWDLVALQSSGEGGPPAIVRGADLRFTSAFTFREDGTFEYVSNGEVVRSGDYEVRRYEVGGRLTEPPYLFLDGDGQRFGVAGDRLFFDDRIKDGPLSEYARR